MTKTEFEVVHHMGSAYLCVCAESDDEANRFMERNPSYAVLVVTKGGFIYMTPKNNEGIPLLEGMEYCPVGK